MCEDYPCCGHTPSDPCGVQDYDRPGYYDTTVPGNEHALCDHENGECDVDEDYDDEDDDLEFDGETDDGFALASAGFGTEEDYGYFGGMED